MSDTATHSGDAAKYRLFRAAKYLVYLLLSFNVYLFLQEELQALSFTFADGIEPGQIIQAFSATIDTAAWVILLLMFMVAGIYFMKELLLWVFTRILLQVRSKRLLSLLFCLVSAFLSAFLDALTVTAVLISVGVGFYSVYHKVASGSSHDDHDHSDDGQRMDVSR